jgi:hypothetical protein
MIPASEELLATLDMACGCVSERTFPEAGLAHLMDDGLVTCPEHGWTTLTSLSDVEVVKVAPRGEYKRLFLACRCHYYEDGRVDPGDLVVCPDHGEQRVVAARSGRGEPRPNRGIFWPDAHRWRPEDEAAMNETGEHPLLPPSGRDLAGLLLSWLRERDSDWGEIAKWRSKLGHIFPPVEHWLLRMAGALRRGALPPGGRARDADPNLRRLVAYGHGASASGGPGRSVLPRLREADQGMAAGVGHPDARSQPGRDLACELPRGAGGRRELDHPACPRRRSGAGSVPFLWG